MVCYNMGTETQRAKRNGILATKKGWAKEMPTGRESVLREMREQELKRAKKIVEVNRKILMALRDDYRRFSEECLSAECNDPKTEAAYDDMLDAVLWNCEQSAVWLCKLERSNSVGILE